MAGRDALADGVKTNANSAHSVPRRTAIAIGLVSALGAVSLGIATQAVAVAIGGVVCGFTLGLAIAGADSERQTRSVVSGGGLLAIVGVISGGGGWLFATGATAAAGVGIGAVAIGLGVSTLRYAVIGDGAVSRAIAWLLRVAFVIGTTATFTAVITLNPAPFQVGTAQRPLLRSLVFPAAQRPAAFGFIAAAWLAVAGLWAVRAVIPPTRVFPAAVRTRYQTVRDWVSMLIVGGIGGGSLLVGGSFLFVAEQGSVGSVLGAIVASSRLRLALIQLALFGVALTGLIGFIRSVGLSMAYRRPEWLPAGGLITLVVLIGGIRRGEQLLGVGRKIPVIGQPLGVAETLVGPTTLVLFVAVLGICGVAGALSVFPVLTGVGFLPTASAGPRLVSGGIVVAVVAAAADGGVGPAVFIGLLAGLIGWEMGAYGVEQLRDVGAMPARRDGEAIHAGASVLVGVPVVVGLVGFHRLLTGISGGDGLLAAISIGSLATVVLLVLLWR